MAAVGAGFVLAVSLPGTGGLAGWWVGCCLLSSGAFSFSVLFCASEAEEPRMKHTVGRWHGGRCWRGGQQALAGAVCCWGRAVSVAGSCTDNQSSCREQQRLFQRAGTAAAWHSPCSSRVPLPSGSSGLHLAACLCGQEMGTATSWEGPGRAAVGLGRWWHCLGCPQRHGTAPIPAGWLAPSFPARGATAWCS